MGCWVSTAEDAQLLLMRLLLVVLKGEVTHGNYPFLLDPYLSRLLVVLFVHHVVAERQLKDWAADLYSDLVLSLVLD